MLTIPFCFTSEKAKEIYGGQPPQYQTPLASGFDLRAVDFSYQQIQGYSAIHNVIGVNQEYCGEHIGDSFYLPHQKRILVKTGIRIAIPIENSPCFAGFPIIENEITELQIRSRSGLAYKHGVCVLNGIGTIDNDYRGEIGVILQNNGHEPFEIKIKDRIAQGIFNPLKQCIWQEVSQEDFEANYCNTERGSGGFGSTGK